MPRRARRPDRPAPPRPGGAGADDGFVHVRGAREHNLKDVDVDIPRDALVVFPGVSKTLEVEWRGRNTAWEKAGP